MGNLVKRLNALEVVGGRDGRVFLVDVPTDMDTIGFLTDLGYDPTDADLVIEFNMYGVGVPVLKQVCELTADGKWGRRLPFSDAGRVVRRKFTWRDDETLQCREGDASQANDWLSGDMQPTQPDTASMSAHVRP